jgi:hypothetical protein
MRSFEFPGSALVGDGLNVGQVVVPLAFSSHLQQEDVAAGAALPREQTHPRKNKDLKQTFALAA